MNDRRTNHRLGYFTWKMAGGQWRECLTLCTVLMSFVQGARTHARTHAISETAADNGRIIAAAEARELM